MTRHMHLEFFRLLQSSKPGGGLVRLCPALGPHPPWVVRDLGTPSPRLPTTGAVRNPPATQYH